MNHRHFASKSLMFKSAADNFLARVQAKLKTDAYYNVALAGGSTAQGFFRELLKHKQALSTLINQIRFFFSDERIVPCDSPDSNAGNAMRLLSSLKIPSHNFFPITDAKSYEQLLLKLLPHNQQGLPVFDLIYLGIGNDGHTASLFPHSHLLNNQTDLVAIASDTYLAQQRFSFMPSLISAAKTIIFMASGQQKLAVIKEIIHGTPNPDSLPAQLILGSKHEDLELLTSA